MDQANTVAQEAIFIISEFGAMVVSVGVPLGYEDCVDRVDVLVAKVLKVVIIVVDLTNIS
jgi:hypothetical protein